MLCGRLDLHIRTVQDKGKLLRVCHYKVVGLRCMCFNPTMQGLCLTCMVAVGLNTNTFEKSRLDCNIERS